MVNNNRRESDQCRALNRFIGQKVRLHRKSIGMTLDEMAEILNYKSRGSVHHLESGKFDWKSTTLFILAKETGLDFISILYQATTPTDGDPVMSEAALRATLLEQARTINDPLVKAVMRAAVRTMNESFVRAFLAEIDTETLRALDRDQQSVLCCADCGHEERHDREPEGDLDTVDH